MKLKSFICLILLFLSYPLLVFGADDKPLPWFQIVTGVLAIPATLIGLAYSYILIRKTNLESRKIELEIQEKEQIMIDRGVTRSDQIKEIVKPFIRKEQVNQFILRFIILELSSRLFGVFAGGYSYLLSNVTSLAYNNYYEARNVMMIIFGVLQFLPQIGYTLIFIAIGYPLFKDVNKIIGINIKEVFFSPLKKQGDKMLE